MSKLRIDKLPLDQRSKAFGEQAVYERRELDPGSLSLERRTGSIRSDSLSWNLGLSCQSQHTKAQTQHHVYAASDAAAGDDPDYVSFSFRFNDITSVASSATSHASDVTAPFNLSFPLLSLHYNSLSSYQSSITLSAIRLDKDNTLNSTTGLGKYALAVCINGQHTSLRDFSFMTCGNKLVSGDVVHVHMKITGTAASSGNNVIVVTATPDDGNAASDSSDVEVDTFTVANDTGIDFELTTRAMFLSLGWAPEFSSKVTIPHYQADGTAPTISNVALWTDFGGTHDADDVAGVADVETAIGTKPLLWYPLDGTQALGTQENEGSSVDSACLVLHPAPPKITTVAPNDARLIFGGDGGAVHIPYHSSFERFFLSTDILANPADFTFQLDFQLTGPTSFLGEGTGYTLVDFGPLAKVYVDTESHAFDRITFVSGYADEGKKSVNYDHGSSFGRASKISIAFGIAAVGETRDEKMFLSVKVGSGDWSALTTTFAPTRAGFQHSRPYDIFLGQREDMSLFEEDFEEQFGTVIDNLPFRGDMTRFALYEGKVVEDQGPERARLYLDFTDTTSLEPEDIGRERLPATFESYAAADGGVTFSRGAIKNAKFIAVSGGYKLHEGGADGLTINMTKKLAVDTSSHISGDYTFITSGEHMHVINSRLNYIRAVGLPNPGVPIRQSGSGQAGILDGIYNYGYRFVTSEGTYGPLKRLIPIRAFDKTSVNLGAGAVSDIDINWMKNGFGEYFGRVFKTADYDTPEECYFSVNDKTHTVTLTAGGTVTSNSLGHHTAYGAEEIYPVHLCMSLHEAQEGTKGKVPLAGADIMEDRTEHICHRGVGFDGSSDNRVAAIFGNGNTGHSCSTNGDFACQIAFRPGSHIFGATKNALTLFSVGYHNQDDGGHPWSNVLDIVLERDVSTASIDDTSGTDDCVFTPETMGTFANASDGPRFVVHMNNNVRASSKSGAYRKAGRYVMSLDGEGTEFPGLDNDGKYKKNKEPNGDVGAPDSTGGSGGVVNPAQSPTFWVVDNDYIANVACHSNDEWEIWLINVTQAAAVGKTGEIGKEYVHTDTRYSRYIKGLSTLGTDARLKSGATIWRIGKTKSGTNSGNMQRIKNNGHCSGQYDRDRQYTSAGFATLGGFFSDDKFYHARIWDKVPPRFIDEIAAHGWKRYLPAYSPLGLDENSNQAPSLKVDIAGINETSGSNDTLRNKAPDRETELWNSADQTAFIAEALSPKGLITRKTIFAAFGREILNSPTGLDVAIGITDINDGSFFIGSPSSLDNQLSFNKKIWDVSNLSHRVRPWQDLENNNIISLGIPFWVALDLRIKTRAAAAEKFFSVSNIRVGVNPFRQYNQQQENPGGAGGSKPFIPNNEWLGADGSVTGITDAQFENGFLWLGGHPSITANDFISQFYELRFWNAGYNAAIDGQIIQGLYEDYANKQLPSGEDSEAVLSYKNCRWYAMFRQYDRICDREASPAPPEGEPGIHSLGICDNGSKFQAWGYLGPTLGNTGVANFLNSPYGEIYRGHSSAIAPYNQAAVCDLTTLGEGNSNDGDGSGDTHSEFAFGLLPFPVLDVPGISALELFRSDGVAVERGELREDNSYMQNMFRVAAGQPLRKVARLAFGSRGFRDNTPASVLGEEHIPGTGFVPAKIDGVSAWQGQLVTWGDGNTLKFAEAGPYGWESYPSWLYYDVHSSGGNITAASELDGQLFVFGKAWGVRLLGSVGSPEEDPLGHGVGAYSSRCLAEHGDTLFVFNGKLWVIDTGGNSQEFGLPVQDFLPTHENVRLVVNAKLASLFVIDETTGEVMRFHLPTQTWSVESRDATSLGETAAGDVVWTTRAGNCAKEDSTVYGDDVTTTTAKVGISVTSNGAYRLILGSSDYWTTSTHHVGMRVTLMNTDGDTVESRITTLGDAAGNNDRFTVADTLSGIADADDVLTIYYGAGATGALLDTGPYLLENERGLTKVDFDVLAGTGWEVGTRASHARGELGSRTDIDFVGATTANRPVGFGLRGRWQRIVLRNRVPEEGRLGFVEGELTDE